MERTGIWSMSFSGARQICEPTFTDWTERGSPLTLFTR